MNSLFWLIISKVSLFYLVSYTILSLGIFTLTLLTTSNLKLIEILVSMGIKLEGVTGLKEELQLVTTIPPRVELTILGRFLLFMARILSVLYVLEVFIVMEPVKRFLNLFKHLFVK